MAKTPTVPPDEGGEKVDKPNTAITLKVDGNVLRDRETLLIITKELETRNKGYDELKGITCAAQGYAWSLLRATYVDEPEGENAEEQFAKAVVTSGFAKRTVQRRMQLAAEMVKKGLLKPRTLVLIEDAVTKGEQIPDEALKQMGEKVGKGKNLTDLYRQFGILPPLDTDKPKQVPLTDEQELEQEFRAAITNIERLFKIRDDRAKAGKVMDAAFGAVLDNAAKLLSTIANHPLIKGKFKPVDDDKTQGATA